MEIIEERPFEENESEAQREFAKKPGFILSNTKTGA